LMPELAAALADALERAAQLLRQVEPVAAPITMVPAAEPASWRERLWSCPPETRLGVREVAEALGRPKSAIYRLTSRNGSALPRLPHRTLGGELTFIASEVRSWVTATEVVVVPGRPEPLAIEPRKERAR